MLEIGNALSKQKFRAAAIELLEALETDPSIEVVLLTNSLDKLAFDLFKQREDQEWGLVDCISLVVMRDRGISDALTADTHFQHSAVLGFIEGVLDRWGWDSRTEGVARPQRAL